MNEAFGSVYFRELHCFSAAQWAAFLVGMMVTLGGCLMLPALHRDGPPGGKVMPAAAATSQEQGGQGDGAGGGDGDGSYGGGDGSVGVHHGARGVPPTLQPSAAEQQPLALLSQRTDEGDAARLLTAATVTPSGILVGGWDAPTPKAADDDGAASSEARSCSSSPGVNEG